MILAHLASYEFGQAVYTFGVGVYAVLLHLVGIGGKELVQVNDLQAILLGHLLLDGDDVVDDDRVVDVPG